MFYPISHEKSIFLCFAHIVSKVKGYRIYDIYLWQFEDIDRIFNHFFGSGYMIGNISQSWGYFYKSDYFEPRYRPLTSFDPLLTPFDPLSTRSFSLIKPFFEVIPSQNINFHSLPYWLSTETPSKSPKRHPNLELKKGTFRGKNHFSTQGLKVFLAFLMWSMSISSKVTI